MTMAWPGVCPPTWISSIPGATWRVRPARVSRPASRSRRSRSSSLASDAVHYFEELERDRPFSIVASLADMYAAFDQIRELAGGGARVVAGHDPLVAERFGHAADPPGVITIDQPTL